MKKIVTLLLCLAMIVGFAFSASAATIGSLVDPNNKATEDVLVKFTDSLGASITAGTVYSVDVTFKTLEFSFKADTTSGNMSWDPETHTYRNGASTVTYTLDGTGVIVDAITVKNHSDAAVSADAKFNAAYTTTKNGVTVDIYKGASICSAAHTLATAVGTTPEEAPTVKYDLKATVGTLTTVPNFTVGTVTVTISSAS